MAETSHELDEQFIRRAIRLAMNGRGRVEPNPMVGCVIVKDGRIIGEGYHAQFGGPHAEPTALANCTESPAGATAYVTLEPCCHTNKKTPPCTPRLIEAKIARVVYGCLDPNPDVNGKGVAILRAAGIRVDGPVLEGPAKQLIAPFLARVGESRPYVTLKWAETVDAKIAGPDGERMAITGAASNRVVHQLRARSDAILVGGATLRSDDPQLTAREVEPLRPLLRIALSSRLQIPQDSFVVRTAREIPIVVYTSEKTFAAATDRVSELKASGVDVVALGTNLYVSIGDLLRDVGRRGATHLLVESGGALASALLVGNLSDRLWVFKSSHLVAPPKSRPATEVRQGYVETGSQHIGTDKLTEYLNPGSPVFFAPEPSADFVLARDGQTTSSRP